MSGTNSTTLSVSNVANVTISLSPLAARLRSFGAALALGGSDVIPVAEGSRTYTDSTVIAADFGTTAPEYYWGLAWFSQTPKPTSLKIGRWAKTATAGLLQCPILSPTQQLLSNFTGITAGTLTVMVDSTSYGFSPINLSSASTLPGVAAIISTAMAGPGPGVIATCTWDAVYQRFVLKSGTTGGTSAFNVISTTPLAAAMGITSFPANGMVGSVAETPVAAAARWANNDNSWYGLSFADGSLTPAQHVAVAAFIEAASPSRIYAASMFDPNIPLASSTTDAAYMCKSANYRRTMLQYTSNVNPYAVIGSLLSRALTVDYTGSNTALTLKFKIEPGQIAEYLSQSVATAIENKNCNIFTNYNNGTAIIEQGVMTDGTFIDEVVNLDWLQNYVQTNVYNRLYTSPTKIPQTDDGMHDLATTIEFSLEASVTNGVAAPGQWNGQSFGQLKSGDYLGKGYYVYCPPIATQAQADRELRKTPVFQAAVKLAGAVHHTDVTLNFNR